MSAIPHPNTYRLTLRNARGQRSLVAVSTGGGMMEVINVDGFPVSIGGDYFETLFFGDDETATRVAGRLAGRTADSVVLTQRLPGRTLVQVRGRDFVDESLAQEIRAEWPGVDVRRLSPVLPVRSRPGLQVPFETCAGLIEHDAGRQIPLWQWAVAYEMARGDLSEAEVLGRMVEIVRVLRRSIAQGIEGTHYDDRLLGHQSGAFKRRLEEGRLVQAGALNRTVLYTTALMEVKSAMGVIVAAPTAGACAALPAACMAVAEEMGLSEEDMARAMLAAGLIGVFIASRWTFAAEVGGCQAEGGSAAAMAAAALVTLNGGSLLSGRRGVFAGSAEHARPDLRPGGRARGGARASAKNVLAASNAISCANMALADFDPVIPFDEVVGAAMAVAAQMPRELRCTALGGLATTPTSLRLEGQLKARMAARCGGGCGCE